MATTYQFISSVTVGSGGASSIIFNNIPQTYTDLIIKLSSRNTYASNYRSVYLQLNSTTSGYSNIIFYGVGNATGSFSGGTTENYVGYDNGASATANTFGNTEIYIPNYTSSNNKSYSTDSVTENNATDAVASLSASLLSNSAAITSLTLIPDQRVTNTFAQYTTAYLYGIKNS